MDRSDPHHALLEQQRDARQVRCAECGLELADRYDIAPNCGIEVYERAFCDWPCAERWAADCLHRMWANGDVPEEYL